METNLPTIQMVFNVTNENKMSLITKDINPRAKQFFSDTYYFVFTLYTSTGLENNSFLCPKRYLKGKRVSNSSVLSSWQLCLCQGISLLGHIINAWWRKWLKWIQQNLAKTQRKMWLTLLTLTASILSCSTFSTTTGTLSNIFVCFSSLCIFVFVFKNKLPVDWWQELSLAEPHSLMSSAVCSALNTNKYWT